MEYLSSLYIHMGLHVFTILYLDNVSYVINGHNLPLTPSAPTSVPLQLVLQQRIVILHRSNTFTATTAM
jgi:hypothetical protein